MGWLFLCPHRRDGAAGVSLVWGSLRGPGKGACVLQACPWGQCISAEVPSGGTRGICWLGGNTAVAARPGWGSWWRRPAGAGLLPGEWLRALPQGCSGSPGKAGPRCIAWACADLACHGGGCGSSACRGWVGALTKASCSCCWGGDCDFVLIAQWLPPVLPGDMAGTLRCIVPALPRGFAMASPRHVPGVERGWGCRVVPALEQCCETWR